MLIWIINSYRNVFDQCIYDNIDLLRCRLIFKAQRNITLVKKGQNNILNKFKS